MAVGSICIATAGSRSELLASDDNVNCYHGVLCLGTLWLAMVEVNISVLVVVSRGLALLDGTLLALIWFLGHRDWNHTAADRTLFALVYFLRFSK